MTDPDRTKKIVQEEVARALRAKQKQAMKKVTQTQDTDDEQEDPIKGIFSELPDLEEGRKGNMKSTQYKDLREWIKDIVDVYFDKIPNLNAVSALKWKSQLEGLFERFPYAKKIILTADYRTASDDSGK